MDKISELYETEGRWRITFQNGVVVDLEEKPIEYEYIGESLTLAPLDENPEEHCYESYWNFKFGLCPFRLKGKWGFVDDTLSIVIQPVFDFVGEINSRKCSCWRPEEYLHQTIWTDGLCSVLYKGNWIHISENELLHTPYALDVKIMSDFDINGIIKLSHKYVPDPFKQCPWAYKDNQGRTLDHGKAILETEEQCCAYMAAYGPMHRHKLLRALDDTEFPYNFLANGVEIYDWGCGQGIGTIAIIEKLRQYGLLDHLRKVTLEEPSDVARKRAVLHVGKALENRDVEIMEVSELLPSDMVDDKPHISTINVEQPCAIHIFSNILDIEEVSLKGVSKMITSSGQRHIVLCIGPANLNESRINSFGNYFIDNQVQIFTDFRDTNFGRHPNRKAYGCLIKSFTYNLVNASDVLHKYNYFAPLQYFASFANVIQEQSRLKSAFEIVAPFDMTAHKNLCPVYALLSNLISRGLPTFASKKVVDYLANMTEEQRQINLNAVARIQKTFVEALISDRLNLSKNQWNVLILEDDSSVAKVALEDFYELYQNLIAITADYDEMQLPSISIDGNTTANSEMDYDAIIDVSIGRVCDAEETKLSKYKALNDCYFIVRSSEKIHEDRILYTTERIKYKQFVEKDGRGNYLNIEENCSRLRYFLNLIFRKDDFRPGQLPILNRALQLQSVIGLLPTGGGKSLTYQLAAMLQPAITLVVDPLKGLMKDQYDGLIRSGIDCISYINSDIKKIPEEGRRRELALTGSQVQIMFLSPERLSIYRFREVLRSMYESNIYFAYGVIDEVHCVSEWGHDFRLAYLHLGRNLFNFVHPKEMRGEDGHISLFGLTATASFDVLADVERELSGSNAYSLGDDATVRYENTNRLELQYNVYEIDAENAQKAREVDGIKEAALKEVIDNASAKLTDIQNASAIDTIKRRFVERENLNDKEKIDDIAEAHLNVDVATEWYDNVNTDTAAIVFCPKANNDDYENVKISVPTVERTLRRDGLQLLSTYRGGDDTSCQDAFLAGKTNTMVATKAFGMGIDKSNVRLTFHLNYPGSLESFVQEAGRAGRDKKMALATIMYSPKKFWVKNVRSGQWQEFSSDYINNKFFYDSNFLGEKFELYVMELLMNNLQVKISNEEFSEVHTPTIANSNGIIYYIKKYENSRILTYYVSYKEKEEVLDRYNQYLSKECMPVFKTHRAKGLKNDRGFSYIKDYGSADYKDAIQKAIYRMCIIGLIDDFTEDYFAQTFRITTVCQDETEYYNNLRCYYRKYYSAERVDSMINEVKTLANKEGVIMACLKHLTSFTYRSIAEKRARGILDMEQFCNMAIRSNKDWKETNEDLKDFIYYYFNSKYAREGFVTYDSKQQADIPFSLKDDTNHDIHKESEITDFKLVKKYMRVVDPEIVNNDSQMDNIKHLQGAIRLIRRAIVEMNPVLNLLNVFCILYLGQESNDMLEDELYNDFKAVYQKYSDLGKLKLIDDFTKLLMHYTTTEKKYYIDMIKASIQLDGHAKALNNIKNRYTNYD